MRRGAFLLTGTVLVAVLAAGTACGEDAPQTPEGVRFAAEHVWAQDYFLREDLKLGSEAQTRANLDALLGKATAILQDLHRDGDTACPIRLAARKVEYYRIGDPRFPGAARKRGELRFPGDAPGVYLAPGPGPSFATGLRIYVWLEENWGRLKTSGGWALAHEHGHIAGLAHLDVRRGAPCQLMSYGEFAAGCGGGRILKEEQCLAYLRAAPETRGFTRCLIEDASQRIGVSPAPAGTPCSDGSGTCNARGLCVPHSTDDAPGEGKTPRPPRS